MNVLFVHEHVPRPDRNGADFRLMQLLDELRAQNHSITFVARREKNAGPYREMLESMGIAVFADDAERLRAFGFDIDPKWNLDQVLRSTSFDLAVLTLWFWDGISIPEHYISAIRKLTPGTQIAILTDDVHFLRESYLAKITRSLVDWERAQNYKQRESEIYDQSDLVISISSADQLSLRQVTSRPIKLLSMVARCRLSPGAGFNERAGLLHFGDFDNFASRDAMQWFLRTTWPKIKKRLRGIRLYVAGNNIPVDPIWEDKDVIRLGYLPSLNDALNKSRIFISPFRFGTGLSTKLLTTMSFGLPVVTGPTPSPGLYLQNEINCLMPKTSTAFSDAVVRLHTDPSLWDRLSQNELSHVRECFSKAVFQEQLSTIFLEPRQIKANQENYFASCLAVEQYCPKVISFLSGHDRVVFRCHMYLKFAAFLISQSKPTEAIIQARHIFSFIPRGLKTRKINKFQSELLDLMEKCYREMSDGEGVERCRKTRRKLSF